MAKQKLNIRFHNPNSDAETIEYIARIFIDASKIRFEYLLKTAKLEIANDSNSSAFESVVTCSQ